MKKIIFAYLLFITCTVTAQDGVLFGEKPTAIENSAEVEIYSTTKGLLIPTLTTVERDAMPNTADGLLIYNETMHAYNYWNGTMWITLPLTYVSYLTDDNNDTKVKPAVSTTSDEDKIYLETPAGTSVVDANGIDLMPSTATYSINSSIVYATKLNNTFVGESTNSNISTGNNNTSVGKSAGTSLSTGSNNTSLGYKAGEGISTTNNNVNVGVQSASNSIASNNTNIGFEAGNSTNASGVSNVFLGAQAGKSLTAGEKNVYIGNSTAYTSGAGSSVLGSNNILIGNNLLLTTDASDSIKIGKNISANANTGIVTFNKAYTFPAATGAVSQTLLIDSDNKTLVWGGAGSSSSGNVTGAAANMYTFDIVKRSGQMQLQKNMLFIPLTPYADAQVNKVITYLKAGAVSADLEVALYNDAGLMIAEGVQTFTSSNGFVTVDITPVAPWTSISVETGKEYKLGIKCNVANKDMFKAPYTENVQFLRNTPTATLNSWDAYLEPFPADLNTLPANRYLGTTNTVPWLRLF